MKTNQNWSRRKFLRSSTIILGATVIPKGLAAKSSAAPSLRFTIQHKGKKLGIKLTRLDKSHGLITIRDLRGKRLAAAVIGPTKSGASSGKMRKSSKISGKTITVNTVSSDRGLNLSCNRQDVLISRTVYDGGKYRENKDISQGFFSWVRNLVSDLTSIVLAGATWLLGGAAFFKLSNGGRIFVDGSGDTQFQYSSSAGGFKLEPGMEENPIVWY